MVVLEKFAAFCKSREKPLMISESAPFGGILDAKTLRRDPDASNRAGYGGNTWNRWFEPVMKFIRTHDVRMWSYIDCDWDALPMYASEENHAPGVYWGDSRLEGTALHCTVQRVCVYVSRGECVHVYDYVYEYIRLCVSDHHCLSVYL